jgi:threonine/homoserine/homoserine lactone efflux protein
MGVTYLIWLGFRKLLARDDGDEEIAVQPEPLPRVFEHGLLVQVLKSKVALFFLAFWSQFVDPSREPVWSQVLGLGATFTVLGYLNAGLYALVGGTVGG